MPKSQQSTVFDLGIDSPIAPKELIDINPLAEYKNFLMIL